jgi:PAT family beta-lactamase induction signal transducer AmpG
MTSASKSLSLREILRDRRLALMLALGFSSGLPFLLIFSTQSAWLREAGVSRSAIGLMSYAALAFTFKFAWAPFIDKYDPPFVGRWLGRRRGWMLIAQIGVAAGLSGLAFGAPAESLSWSVVFAFLTAFAAASQFVEPLGDLMRRYGSGLIVILVLVAIYRLPDFVSGVMANPLYIDLGFTKSDIATVSKLYGVWIGIAGAFGGGAAVARLGLMPSLILGGVAASSSHLTLALLAAHGASLPLLTLSVSAESFAGAALIAYMSSLVSPAFAATQYALLSSLYALPGKLIGGLSGVMVDEFGYVRFFIATAAIGIPVVTLSLTVWRIQRREAEGAPA